MITRQGRLLVAVVVIVAAGSFALTWAGRAGRAGEPPTTRPQVTAINVLGGWLDLSADQRDAIEKHDPKFADDLARLRSQLAERRAALASVLESSDSPDELIRQHVEAMIAASAELQRRVTEHLLTVRHHLTPAQQQRLFDLCAQGVREGQGWRHGQRRGQNDAGSPGRYRGGRQN